MTPDLEWVDHTQFNVYWCGRIYLIRLDLLSGRWVLWWRKSRLNDFCKYREALAFLSENVKPLTG